jgi:DNA-binding PadR family transcriptional regulator
MPRSGYDLKKAFDSTVANIWPANQSQIYRTLARLANAGLIEMHVIEQDGKPNRKVYRITDKGLSELRRWLVRPLSLPPVRDAFLIQLFWADAITKDEILRLLKAVIRAHKRRRCDYHQMLNELCMAPPVGVWDKVLVPMIVEQGVVVEDAWLAWAERAIEKVRNLPPLERKS